MYEKRELGKALRDPTLAQTSFANAIVTADDSIGLFGSYLGSIDRAPRLGKVSVPF